ncbi:OsmC family protein [Mycobacterium sp. URHB0021]|jgi:OsmC-like protein
MEPTPGKAGRSDDSRAGRFDREYLLQALGGCYTVTLAANAAARGIALDGYRLHLEADFDFAGFLGVDKDRSPEARSPIRDTLVRPIDVTTTLT